MTPEIIKQRTYADQLHNELLIRKSESQQRTLLQLRYNQVCNTIISLRMDYHSKKNTI